ncbi:zinc-dependent alcohol dehydrogenase family protein [Devosia sp. FJ2-5-3]|uniref:zinc-dependent alcohol dehydrogenase family protein n=1 Tax=Devosia sp. FJ2-5-3 TaxID=2976680 RepID=UPI0023D887ED|nr:zinc-dependent alcohol dehydrogenase family protein [Devosia sp. FJ2-5-3]WEJ60442.1 zinc-dependent alcohol dehydrogenase family protein [Devosia sp. FJ2-5-3]
MRAMRLHYIGRPLTLDIVPRPAPQLGEVLIAVEACGVCRTDLHIADGELSSHRLPLIPGHEVVGRIVETASDVLAFRPGDRVGVPWLASTCGDCPFCIEERENLCDAPKFTGYDVDGGYAEYMVARADYCVPLPGGQDPAKMAPLLCAGLIGYRSYRAAGAGQTLGIMGFGAAAHIIAQLAVADGRQVYAMTRPGDLASQKFARELGVTWSGDTAQTPNRLLDAIIIFAPAGELVPRALQLLRKGGRVVCAGIHMSDIPAFPYRDLWNEKQIVSIANLTRGDALEFFDRMEAAAIQTNIRRYPLDAANQALADLRTGSIQGAAVLLPSLQTQY